MELTTLWHGVIMGLVEGVTEFIPVSSTGHLIIAGDWLGLQGERAATFEIFIQLGAILAIVWIYRDRLLAVARNVAGDPGHRRFVLNLLLAFLPAAVTGLAVHSWIKAHLFSPVTVAWALIVGGVAMLVVERLRPEPRVTHMDHVTPRAALGVGLAQVLSLFPGVSRSGATIMGAYALGFSRQAATEFSFFLAIPVIGAATGYDLLKSRELLSMADAPLFATGFVVAFLSSLVVVRVFLGYVSRHTFVPFAWYRIAFGALLLLLRRGA
ncbi:MAG: undecaprenyl-diphosphate phosphatase [Gemmatimonadales bacterium]|nr:undecaprenyl-diphosphate phosphatase [Gemmatimonadales bacterium]